MSDNVQVEVELEKLFYTPIWKFKYPFFERDQEKFVRFLSEDSRYIIEREKNGLQTTVSNLHKEEELQDLTQFFYFAAEHCMREMGYVPSCGITSMWATRQRPGGHHHKHSHRNSFLGCAFHLFDIDNEASGTVFTNPNIEQYVIQPAVDETKEPMFVPEQYMSFESGTLLMFPAWASHYTMPTNCGYRIVVAANFMPVGQTNSDHYDRYNFPNPYSMPLKEYE